MKSPRFAYGPPRRLLHKIREWAFRLARGMPVQRLLLLACVGALCAVADGVPENLSLDLEPDPPWAGTDPFASAPDHGPPVLEIQLEAARQALAAGLPRVARTLMEETLLELDESSPHYVDLVAGLAEAHLSIGNYENTLRLIEKIPPGEKSFSTTIAGLLASIQLNGKSVLEKASETLDPIDPDKLTEDDRAWFHLAKGILLSRLGSHAEALSSFDQASESTHLPRLQRLIRIVSLMEKARSPDADEHLERDLRRQLDETLRPELRIPLVRTYAFVLRQLEKSDEAIQLLLDEIPHLTEDHFPERDELKLLVGLWSGTDSARGRDTLRSLLETGRQRQAMSSALDLLLGSGEVSPAEMMEWMDDWMDREAPHPLLDELLFARAALAAQHNRLVEAADLLDRLEENYPGTGVLPIAQRIRAYIAWRNEPPRLRTAAIHLLDSIEGTPDSSTQADLLSIAGDLYLLNQDFSNAEDAYRRSISKTHNPAKLRERQFNRVHALIRGGSLDGASEILDQSWAGEDLSPDSIWKLEWNLSVQLRAEGRAEEALSRVRDLLAKTNGKPPPGNSTLKPRMLWLEAYLLNERGDHDEALSTIGELLEKKADGDPPDPLLAGQGLLLKGQILLAKGDRETAAETFETIRNTFPESRPAILTLLLEARHFAANDSSIEAQQRLVSLAETHPGSEYAPHALYEAAETALARGTESGVEEAIKFFDQIYQAYPDHPLAIEARLRQAFILSGQQRFSAARSVHESILRRYPEHPMRPRVELYWADTIVANPTASAELLATALAVYRRIAESERAETEIRMEAAYKAATVLARTGRPEEAIGQKWYVVRLYREASASGTARYWLARSIFDLGDYLEASGGSGEALTLYRIVIDEALPGQAIAGARMRRLEPSSPSSSNETI